MLIARLADGLTLARTFSGVVLAVLIARERFEAAAILLSLAWLSDALDGRLARAASAPTRLGEWDLPADVALAAGLVVGLGAAGALPAWLAVVALVALGGGYLALRQPALGMALQGIAYGAFLWTLFDAGAAARWAPVAVALGIAIAERRKLLRVELPAFFGGIAAAARLRRGEGLGLPEDRRPPDG